MRKKHDFSKAKPNPHVTGQVFDGLQDFVEACKQIDDWRQIDDADWDEEIGALREVTGELIPDPPMLLFDNIKGYPAGFRVVGLLTASYKRAALALGLPVHEPRAKLSERASRKMREVQPIPPVEVTDGPVMQNVHERRRGGPPALPGAPLPCHGRGPLHRHRRLRHQPRSGERVRERRDLPHAGPRPRISLACG